MNKIFKWLMWVLIAVSVVILLFGFIKGYPSSPAENDYGTVDSLLYWAYAMVGITIFCVVVVGIIIAAMNNPKSLVKLGVGLVAIAAVVLVVYLVSAGDPAVGLSMDQPSAGTLKLTDTVLNLTYLTGALAVLAIVFGEILAVIRNR